MGDHDPRGHGCHYTAPGFRRWLCDGHSSSQHLFAVRFGSTDAFFNACPSAVDQYVGNGQYYSNGMSRRAGRFHSDPHSPQTDVRHARYYTNARGQLCGPRCSVVYRHGGIARLCDDLHNRDMHPKSIQALSCAGGCSFRCMTYHCSVSFSVHRYSFFGYFLLPLLRTACVRHAHSLSE